jgi:hypothetical protein
LNAVRRWQILGLVGLVGGCFLSTARPAYSPLLGSPSAEVRLGPDSATQRLAEALKDDSIPISRVETRDGYLETPWFDASTGAAARTSPLGPNVVRVRGWVDPGRIGHSDLRVEIAYRAVRDPSVPERELERAAPTDHPVVQRVRSALDSLKQRYGDPVPPPVIPDTATTRPPFEHRPPPEKDEAPPKEEAPPRGGAPVNPDSAALHPARPDSMRQTT